MKSSIYGKGECQDRKRKTRTTELGPAKRRRPAGQTAAESADRIPDSARTAGPAAAGGRPC
eukprot:763930-Hanusia_phi.AAC.13